jgi:hypothetical protein
VFDRSQKRSAELDEMLLYLIRKIDPLWKHVWQNVVLGLQVLDVACEFSVDEACKQKKWAKETRHVPEFVRRIQVEFAEDRVFE